MGEPDLASVVRAARVGSFAWLVRSDELRWSDELCRMHGIEPSEFDGTFDAFLRFVHPADRERVKEIVEEVLRERCAFTYDHRIVRPDGEERTIHSQGALELDADARPSRVLGACWDVTEPAEANRELEHSMSLLRATLDATDDGILVVDREQRVVTFNERFLELWRIPPDMAERRDDAELLDDVGGQLSEPEAFMRKVRELYDTPEAESRDVLRFRDGRIFERCSKPQRVGDEVVGRVWSFHDVTAREKAVEARELFLATAAHEIRGPLTSLRLAMQTLQEGLLPPSAQPRLLGIADREIGRLSRFVDQLLDVGRLRTDRLELDYRDVDLADVVEETADSMAHEIERSGSEVRIRADARPIVRADPVRLGQIVQNLLSNAIKLGEGRPVDVVIEQRDGAATLAVTDRGIGMTDEEVDHIFEPFERRVSTKHYGGLGLGLHIVRSLLDAMGGDVRVESELGRGSTFTVELSLGSEPCGEEA